MRALILVFLLFKLFACKQATTVVDHMKSNATLDNRRWKLIKLEDFDVLPYLGKDIFIQFDKIKTRVTGHAGCNVINGGYSFDGINLKIGPIATSKMMCESTQMQIESEFTKALSLSDNVFIVGDKLQLRNGRSVLAELEGM